MKGTCAGDAEASIGDRPGIDLEGKRIELPGVWRVDGLFSSRVPPKMEPKPSLCGVYILFE